MKKLISLALVLVMALSILPMAFAAGVQNAEKPEINATAAAPKIDGTIEAAWGGFDGCMDYDESVAPGADKPDKVEFWYMYDANNLYIAAKLTMAGVYTPERSRVQPRIDLNANNSVWDAEDSLGVLSINKDGKAMNAAADSAIAKGTLAGKLEGTVATFEMSIPLSALGDKVSVKADSTLRVGVTVWDDSDKQYGATLGIFPVTGTAAPAAPAAPAEDEKTVIEVLKPRGTINFDGNVTVEEWGVPSITAENETTTVDFYFRHDDKGVYIAAVAKSEVMAAGGYQAGLVYRYQKDSAAAPAYIGCSVVKGDGTQVNNWTGKLVRNGGDIVMEVFQTWEAMGVTKGKDIYGQFQWLDYAEQSKSVVLNPNGTDVISDFITFSPVDKVAPDKVETPAPSTPATPSTPSTPATFDAGIIAAVVALTAGAGVIVSKKRR